MKIIVILCLVLLSSCSQDTEVLTGHILIRDGITYHQDTNEPITGTVEYFFDDGRLERRESYKDGERDGLWDSFYEDGQLQWRRNYKDGEDYGLFEFFYSNSQLTFSVNHIDGERDGLHEYFDKYGNLTRTRTFRNGVWVETNENP
jgi:antitoxin component YwqK of YwqJK toxin-antitoxin module